MLYIRGEMKKNLHIGILRETKVGERRAPITPSDVKRLVKKGIKIEVESNPLRIFKDREYKKAGARIVNRFKKASLLVGIKEPQVDDLYPGKIYMLFSHTIKGQPKNMPLLKSFLRKNITLIDYEKVTDSHNKRLVYFGRFAGICGFVDGLHYLGKKLEWEGIKNPFLLIKPASEYSSYKNIKSDMEKLDYMISKKGFSRKISPIVIGITGHGNVSKGVAEVFEILNPEEIHPKDILQFIKHQRGVRNRIYKIVFLPEEKLRSKDNKRFYYEEYLKYPERYNSNLDKYLPYINMLVNGSYWDSKYPRMVTKKMVDKLSKKKNFRLRVIEDIASDIDGSIELTYKTTTREDPTFTYHPKTKNFIDGYLHNGVTILAMDNLPSELPKDASQEFSNLIREYVYEVASCGVHKIMGQAKIPDEIKRAVITENRKLTKNFRYLRKWVR